MFSWEKTRYSYSKIFTEIQVKRNWNWNSLSMKNLEVIDSKSQWRNVFTRKNWNWKWRSRNEKWWNTSIHSSFQFGFQKLWCNVFTGEKRMQDTTRPRWLKWTTYHLIVYVVMSDFNVSLAASTDYGRQMKPFFNDIPNFWANWADRLNIFWGIWGIFGWTIT